MNNLGCVANYDKSEDGPEPVDVSSPSRSLLVAAEGILNDLQQQNVKSVYSFDNVKEGSIYKFNCYGFINYLIQKSYLKAYQELVDHMYNNGRIPVSVDGQPCPFHYVDF